MLVLSPFAGNAFLLRSIPVKLYLIVTILTNYTNYFFQEDWLSGELKTGASLTYITPKKCPPGTDHYHSGWIKGCASTEEVMLQF